MYKELLKLNNKKNTTNPIRKWAKGMPGWLSCLASDFSSVHDLTVHKFEPCVGFSAVRVEPTWNPLSPLSLTLPHSHSVSKINKHLKNKEKKMAKRHEQTFQQKIYLRAKRTHVEMFNITNHQRNVS